MSVKHTEGTWEFHEQGDANEWCVITVDGRWVISFRQNGELLNEKQLANARLMAAAPALLRELMLLNLDDKGEQRHNTPAHLIIAKATGITP